MKKTICPSCYSFNIETGEIFLPKETEKDLFMCTNPDCKECFSIEDAPFCNELRFGANCPNCGSEPFVEDDEAYQIKEDGSFNIFPWEILKYDNDIEEEKKKKVDPLIISQYSFILGEEKTNIPPKPEWLEGCNSPIPGKKIYPVYEDEEYGYEGDINWWEVHYCPICKEEYGFSNGT